MEKTFNYQSDANFYDKKDFIIATLKRKINSFKMLKEKNIMLVQNKKLENQNLIQMNQKMDLVQIL